MAIVVQQNALVLGTGGGRDGGVGDTQKQRGSTMPYTITTTRVRYGIRQRHFTQGGLQGVRVCVRAAYRLRECAGWYFRDLLAF